MQHVAGELHSAKAPLAAQAMQLQLPKNGLTMAMTCCDMDDMDDRLQDINFAPSSPSTSSDFVLFSTVTDTEHRLSPPVQVHYIQNNSFQTVSRPTDFSAKPLQLLEPLSSLSAVTTTNCTQSFPTMLTPARSDRACAVPTVTGVASEVEQAQPPAAPRRSLPQSVFASPGQLVRAKSPLPATLPRSAVTPSILLCTLLRQCEAGGSNAEQHLHTLTSSCEAHALAGSSPSPITCADDLLQKLVMFKTGNCRE